MENQPKYYTPDIREFHVGFEFEYLNLDNEWEPTVIRERDCFKYLMEFPFRVKILDKEDIESLGYKQSGLNKEIFHGKTVDDPINGKFTYGIALGRNELVIFNRYEVDGHVQDIFRGIVKNKSELQRILKMVVKEEE